VEAANWLVLEEEALFSWRVFVGTAISAATAIAIVTTTAIVIATVIDTVTAIAIATATLAILLIHSFLLKLLRA